MLSLNKEDNTAESVSYDYIFRLYYTKLSIYIF